MPSRTIPLHALPLAMLAVLGCHDFSLSDLPEPDAPINLEVSPLRVAPGGRLAIRFELGSSASVEVSVNGLPATFERLEGARQHWAYVATGDEGEILNVVVVARVGANGRSASTQAFLDAQPPAAPDSALLVAEARPPGEADRLSGLAGCVEGSDVRTVRVALDPAGRLEVGEALVEADGSFPPVDLGDNALARLFVLALDEAGNRSEPVAVDNDVAGPRALSLSFSPRVPRAGRSLAVRVRFDESVDGPPEARLRAGEQAQALQLARAGAEWEATVESLELPAGPAFLSLSALDPAGNPGGDEIALEIAEPDELDLSALRLRRSAGPPAGWTLRGEPGAAPFPSQLEIALLAEGEPPAVLATRLAASDGSFDSAWVAASLEPADRVRVTAFDDSGAELARAVLVPDLQPPVLAEVLVEPLLAGPAVPATITVLADDPIAEGSSVSVGGQPAAREPAGDPARAVFVYTVAGDEGTGPVDLTVRLLDPAGNETLAEVPSAFTIDLSPPQVTLATAQGPYAPPSVPPADAFTPPASLTVAVEDPLAGLASAAWSLVDLRTGGSWDGQAYVSADPPVEHAGSDSFPVELAQATPQNERVELRVRAEDAVGNATVRRQAFSRYADSDWWPVGPSVPGGVGLALSRTGATGLCVLAYRCRTGSTCEDAWYEGRLAAYFSPDGGRTWEPPRDLGLAVSWGYPSVWRLEYDEAGEHGMAVGEGALLRLDATCSLDGTPAVLSGGATDFYSAAWDGATAWAAAEDGLYRSLDAGLSWEKSTLGSIRFNGVAVAAPGTVIGVGSQAVVARTTDGGESWATQSLPGSSAELWDVGLDYDGSLLLGGDQTFSSSVDGVFWQPLGYTSTEDWSVWRIHRSPAGVLLRILDRNPSWYLMRPTGPWDHLVTDVNSTETMDVVDLDGWAMFAMGSDLGAAWSLRVDYSVSGGF